MADPDPHDWRTLAAHAPCGSYYLAAHFSLDLSEAVLSVKRRSAAHPGRMSQSSLLSKMLAVTQRVCPLLYRAPTFATHGGKRAADLSCSKVCCAVGAILLEPTRVDLLSRTLSFYFNLRW